MKEKNNHTVLITGIAGFIGFHLAKDLLEKNWSVIGVDNLNDYYDENLKVARLHELGIVESTFTEHQPYSNKDGGLIFYKGDISNRPFIHNVFEAQPIAYVVHLAAQAGVRYSLQHPEAYIQSNVNGFFNLLQESKDHKVAHFVYASSSSVYGLNEKMPLATTDNVDHPISLYAATKKSNELFAHAYAHLYQMPATGLRFFTVYGPWGRPDMALFLFTKAILNDEPIDVYNYGEMERDFTYVDDIVDGIEKVLEHPPTPNKDWDGQHPDPSNSPAPYRIYNIGNNKPVKLMDFIKEIERKTGKKAKMNLMPIQEGDVLKTEADIQGLNEAFNYEPKTSVREGVDAFVDWYMDYYKIDNPS